MTESSFFNSFIIKVYTTIRLPREGGMKQKSSPLSWTIPPQKEEKKRGKKFAYPQRNTFFFLPSVSLVFKSNWNSFGE